MKKQSNPPPPKAGSKPTPPPAPPAVTARSVPNIPDPPPVPPSKPPRVDMILADIIDALRYHIDRLHIEAEEKLNSARDRLLDT